jgi:sn-glycerol 3-phosphate transport system ATP-binding protein
MAPIAIRQVRKSYGKQEVVHGVDLDIAHGEFVVILGPSGCGKSTLLRMVAGLEAISAGEIAIDGEVVNRKEPRERGCAMVFQNYALYPHMTVAQNIGYGLKVAGVPKAERARRVAEVAWTLAISEFLERKPGQLSGGQRQRVAMGRAMIREPKVFLFDEPLSNLDAKLRVQMRIEIRKLHQRLGATSIFVTHDQVEAMTLADRLVVMNKGHVEQAGTPSEIYHKPASIFVAGFIGAPGMNLLSATVDGEGYLVLGDGQRISPPNRGHADLVAGRKLVVGIRAEALRLVAEPAATTLTTQFEFVEELGSGRQVHCDLAGEALIVHTDRPAGFAPRSRLLVEAPAGQIHLFDAQNGLRLAASGAGEADLALVAASQMQFAPEPV